MNDLNGPTGVEPQGLLAESQPRLRNISSRQKWLGIVWLIVLGLSVAIIVFVIWNNREALLITLKTARRELFILTFICYVMANIAMVLGWHTGLRAFRIPTSLWSDLKIYFYTLAARRVPGTIWYIAGRSVLYERLSVPKRVTSALSGIEMIISFLTGMILGFPALLIYLNPSLLMLLVSVGIIVVCLIILHPSVMSSVLRRFMHQEFLNSLRYRSMLIWSFWCCIMWILGGLMIFSIVIALYNLNLSYLPLVITSWALSGAISFVVFFLPHNFGITEITLTFLLSRIIPLPIAITVALLSRVITTVIDIMFLSVFVLDKSIRNSE